MRPRWVTWLRRAAAALGLLLVLALGALAVTTGTAWGRARLLAIALNAARGAISGRVEVRALDRLDPFRVTLRGVRLLDPASNPVVSLDVIDAELSPVELVSGRVVLRALTLGTGRVDLRALDAEGRGLLAALRAPSPSPPAAPGAPPYVRVDALRVSGLEILAPELAAPWQAASVRRLDLHARAELDVELELELLSLAAELWRGEQQVARLTRATGRLGRPGQRSALELDLELGAARLALWGGGVLPAAGASFSAVPLAAGLKLGGLQAPELARVLDDEALAAAFAGAVDLELQVEGHLEELAARAGLRSAAGTLELRGGVRQRRLVRLQASAEGLRLGALRAGLPEAPLAFALEASADIAEPARVPLRLAWQRARLGGAELPDVSASAVWDGRALRELMLTAGRGSSALQVRGSAAVDGLFELELDADVRQAELGALSRAAGVPGAPRGSLGAELRVARAAGERWAIEGWARARGVAWAGLTLSSARADVALHGPLLGLRGEAELVVDGLTHAGLDVRTARLRLDASGRGYRLRASGTAPRTSAGAPGASAALDLRARREPAAMLVSGAATAQLGELPLALRLSETRVGFDGSLVTRGLVLDAAGQELRVAGSVAERVELVASMAGVDLGVLSARLGLARGWRGHADVELRARGRAVAPRVDATLRLRELARDGAPGLGATLGATLDLAQRRAILGGAVSGEADWLEAAFSVASELPPGPRWWEHLGSAAQRAAIEIGGLELGALGRWLGLSLPVSGRLALSSTLSGSLARPSFGATLRARLAGLGLAALTLEQRVAYDAGSLDAETSLADAAGRSLELAAHVELPQALADDLTSLPRRARELGDASRWALSLEARPRALGALWAAAPVDVRALQASASLQLEHAPHAEPSGRVALHVEQPAAAAARPGCATRDVRLELLATLDGGVLDARLAMSHAGAALLAGAAHAPVLIAPALRGGGVLFGSLSGQLASRGLELGSLPLACGRIQGHLDATARAEDLLGDQPVLELDVKAAGLSLGAEPRLDLALRGHADRDDASLGVEITAPNGRGTLRAALPIDWRVGKLRLAADAPLRGRLELEQLPIAPFLDPAGAVSYVSGRLSGEVDVLGTLGEPQPSGHLELLDAELTATALAQPLHDVQGRFSFDRRSLVIERFSARDRDGELQLSGKLERQAAGESLAVQLSASAKQFPLRQRGQIVATTSGHAEIGATITAERSTVRVKLVDADTWLEKFQARSGIDLQAHPDYETAGAEDAIASRAGDAMPPPSQRTSLVQLDASDRFWIKREDFAIQLSTRLEARIGPEETSIKGRVEINRGYLDLLGRVFDVDRGSYLEFTGPSPPDPTVSVTAKYDSKSAGKTVTVQITGRGSKPELTFLVDDAQVSAGEALEVLLGGRSSGGETSAKEDAASFVRGLTAGLLATSARRELGAAAPIIMIEPGEQTGAGRIRAGFELDALVPRVLRPLITGVYVEGIVERESSTSPGRQSQGATTQAGVLVELYFPHSLFTTGQWGPGTTWSLDWGWQL